MLQRRFKFGIFVSFNVVFTSFHPFHSVSYNISSAACCLRGRERRLTCTHTHTHTALNFTSLLLFEMNNKSVAYVLVAKDADPHETREQFRS